MSVCVIFHCVLNIRLQYILFMKLFYYLEKPTSPFENVWKSIVEVNETLPCFPMKDTWLSEVTCRGVDCEGQNESSSPIIILACFVTGVPCRGADCQGPGEISRPRFFTQDDSCGQAVAFKRREGTI